MSKSSISLKGVMDPQGFALLLEDVAKSVKAGTVCLQKSGEFVTLKPVGPMSFEIEAGVKKGKQKLEISVKWEEALEPVSAEDIKISDVEPEIPVEEPALEAPAGCEPAAEAVPHIEVVNAPVEAPVESPAEEPAKDKKGRKK